MAKPNFIKIGSEQKWIGLVFIWAVIINLVTLHYYSLKVLVKSSKSCRNTFLFWSDFSVINFSQLKNGINWAEKSVPFVLSNPKPEFNFKFWPDLSNKYWYFLFWNLILHFTGKQNFLGIHISFGRHYKPLSAISTSAHDNFWLSVMLNLIRAHYL